ncbi:Hypothetical predicted protein [Pelobates cultripes]|uniref:SH3 domain-binding protein 2 n=2 Tax=Pelobates cultripes TaxID=61616 RepID=A0AAD1WD70_PELCU|nr:Hypothetical predicted protein [Pelobates cultripes]
MAINIKRSQSLNIPFERRTMCRLDRIMATGEPSWPTPMKAIGAQNLLTMPGGVTNAGYLHKRGGNHFQLLKWPLRYVIIHKGCVYYFKTSTSASSQGAFSLNGYNRVMRAAEETTSSNVFPFKMVHISKKHRTWYFSAASEDERKKWMLSLRKEIDRYHEKKETVTDLSDESETDSFYDSVERPVNIKYTHNPADDSWQDDDEDDEDYEQPDGAEASAPSYPPPPIPRTKQSERRMSDVPTPIKHLSPISSTKASLPDLKDLDVTNPRKNFPSTKPPPPPIPIFPVVHNKGEPPPPPPIAPVRRISTDMIEKEVPSQRKESTCLPNHNVSEASINLPPPLLQPLPQRRGIINCEPRGTRVTKPQSGESVVSNLSKELNNKFKMSSPIPPPVPTNKSGTDKSIGTITRPPPVPPSKPNNQTSMFKPNNVMTTPSPPVPPNKPRLDSIEKSPNVSPNIDGTKPTLLKISLQKPPPISRNHMAGKNCTPVERPSASPILRTSPDGQSFRAFALETPVIPAKRKDTLDDKSDSEDDYEKVPLPPSVFIDTTESADIERMFKAVSQRGSPENGLFCIRKSAKAGKVLVVWDGMADKVRNYRIFEKDNKVYLEADVLFEDVGSLVEHYYANKLPSHENLILKHAYGCPSSAR